MKRKIINIIVVCAMIATAFTLTNVFSVAETTEQNVALGKPATSSNYLAPHEPSWGNDGNTSSYWTSDTTNPMPAWWAVDLQEGHVITRIELVARQDVDGPEGIRQNFQIWGSNDPTFATYSVLAVQDADTSDFPARGTWTATVTNTNSFRYLRLDRGTLIGMLFSEFRAFAQVEVGDSPTYQNVSLNKPASGTAIITPYEASRGNDGIISDTSMFYSDTGDNAINAYWVVDLETAYVISKIDLTMRQDQDGVDAIRNHFNVYGANAADYSDKVRLAYSSAPISPKGTWEITVTNTNSFRYLIVDREGAPNKRFLIFSEFSAFIDTTPSPTATQAPSPTATQAPSPTATQAPSPTATQAPSPTATQAPSPTATQAPSPTATQAPSPTVTQTPSPTIEEPSPTTTDVSNSDDLNPDDDEVSPGDGFRMGILTLLIISAGAMFISKKKIVA